MDYGKVSKPGLLFGEFKVTPLKEPYDPDGQIAYKLTGKRASYTLWRNQPNPKHLFVMCDPVCKPGKCRGYEWFYEAPCGRLIPFK